MRVFFIRTICILRAAPKKSSAGVLLSAVCLCGALSIYQNYIGVMVGLCIIITIKELFHMERSFMGVVHNGIKKIAAIFAGGILYYGITQIICAVNEIEPSKYSGVNKISPFSIVLSIGHSSIEAIKMAKHFFLHDTYVFNIKWCRDRMFFVFFAILILCIVGLMIEKQIYREKLRVILILVCLLILPVGLNAVFVIAPDSCLYALNSMQMMLVFPLLLCLAEEFELKKYILLKWGGILASIAILFTYYMAANFSYAYLELSYNQARTVAGKIVNRMEMTEGYEVGMPCAFAGILVDEYFPRDQAYRGYTICDIVEGPVFHGNYSGSVGSWKKFCLIYQGENLNFCQPAQYSEVVDTKEFKEMGVFPSQNSVKIINGIAVVKLMEDVPMP